MRCQGGPLCFALVGGPWCDAGLASLFAGENSPSPFQKARARLQKSPCSGRRKGGIAECIYIYPYMKHLPTFTIIF